MSRSAAPDGTCLHLLNPAQISSPPRNLLPRAQTSSDHLSLAQMLSDSSAASRKHVNYDILSWYYYIIIVMRLLLLLLLLLFIIVIMIVVIIDIILI